VVNPAPAGLCRLSYWGKAAYPATDRGCHPGSSVVNPAPAGLCRLSYWGIIVYPAVKFSG